MRVSAFITEQVWAHRGGLARCLWPLSLLTWLWVRTQRWLYLNEWRKAVRLPVPVLVVGNVLAGGTGKTPVVIALVSHFKNQGLRVGVIARAYGSAEETVKEVAPHSPARWAGDEPLLIKQRCDVPVFVGRARAQAALALLKAYPNTELIVSDDGMQHWALWHDMAVCVFDQRGLGNGWLLPAGPLREPWPRRPFLGVHEELVSSSPETPGQAWFAKRALAPCARNGFGEVRDLTLWAGQRVQALAGIAKPDNFFQALEAANLQITWRWPMADHADLSHWKSPSDLPVFCTEKDAVKLWPNRPEVWAVPLVCELPMELLDALSAHFQKLSLPDGHKTA